MASMTPTALGRWSCTEASLPDVTSVTKVNVYDFDNTLFRTPLPSRAVWDPSSIGFLQGYDVFSGGGWWHDPGLLGAVGGGPEKMEPTAWEGWWEEHVVASARESIATPGHLSVLMTGRMQSKFTDILLRILKAKGLSFDLVVLKPEVSPTGQRMESTAAYKNLFFKNVMTTYQNASQLTIWEDRAKQAREFDKFLEDWNSTLTADPNPPRTPFDYHIELIEPTSIAYDPRDEITQVSRMINAHNAAIAVEKSRGSRPYKFETIRKYTGYLIAPADTTKLKSLLEPGDSVDTESIRALADNIMLSFNPPAQGLLTSAGGVGAKQAWRTVSVGNHNNRIWAVRVQPVDANKPHPTERNPMVILGHLPGVKTSESRQIKTWTPIPGEKQLVFTTEVGDKALVRIVPDTHFARNGEQENRKRPRPQHVDVSSADEFPPLVKAQGGQGRDRGRGGSGFGNRQGRGGAPQGPRYGGGGGRGGRSGGRGRGGQYRSLDDAGQHGYGDAEGMQY